MTHEVVTSTVSDELAANKIESLDLLKIDVEGFFMEVLKGIAEPDFARISNIVVEIDYPDQMGVRCGRRRGVARRKGLPDRSPRGPILRAGGARFPQPARPS